MADTSSVDVVDVPDSSRYEALVDGRLAGFVDYVPAYETITFTHTEVEPEFEGRGIGSALAAGALGDAYRRNLRVVVLCPFLRSWLARHPDFEAGERPDSPDSSA